MNNNSKDTLAYESNTIWRLLYCDLIDIIFFIIGV